MPVQRHYTAAEVKSAIDLANAQYYRKLLRVRNDLTGRQLNSAKVKVARDSSGQALNPHEWRGRGSDVGHAFRHVDGTAPTGKSIYRDETTAVAVTLELLNSPKRQAALGRLDGDNPDGDELGMEANRRIVAPRDRRPLRRSRHGPALEEDRHRRLRGHEARRGHAMDPQHLSQLVPQLGVGRKCLG